MTEMKFAIAGESRNATHLDVDAGRHRVVVYEPIELGGNKSAPNPFEYILAGYAGCLNAVGHIVARMGITLHKLSIEMSALNSNRFLGRSFERAGFQV